MQTRLSKQNKQDLSIISDLFHTKPFAIRHKMQQPLKIYEK